MKYNYLSFRDAVFVSTADTMEYVIKCGQEYIFRGIAVKAPGEDNAIINVGEICSQYLDNQMPDFRDFNDVVTKQRNAFRKFTLFRVERTIIWTGPETSIDDVTEHAEAIYNFLYCWDYDDFTWDNEDAVLSDPVNGHLDCRMKLLYTQYGETTGATFYVTPILSARPEGSTVTADILTEYEDPSLLEVRIGNSSITIDSVSLTGATYTTPQNTGDTYSTMADYYYDGEWVGQTQIVIAGDHGGDVPPEPPTPVNWSGNVYISGFASRYANADRSLRVMAWLGFRAGTMAELSAQTYSVSVTGSEYISGITGYAPSSDPYNVYDKDPYSDVFSADTIYHNIIELYLINSEYPHLNAPLGESVNIRIEMNGGVTELTATVVLNNTGDISGVWQYNFDMDMSHSSTITATLSNTGETFYEANYIASNSTYLSSFDGVYTNSHLITRGNYMAFGDTNTGHDVVFIEGKQIYPGGEVCSDDIPWIASTAITNGKKVYTLVSPYPLNYLMVEKDSNVTATTSFFAASDSIVNSVRVDSTVTEITIPLTRYEFRRLRQISSSNKYGTRENHTTLTVHCSDGDLTWNSDGTIIG